MHFSGETMRAYGRGTYFGIRRLLRGRFAPCRLCAAALLFSQLCQGQAASPEADADRPTAAVTLDGRVLLRVRGVGAYPAEQRAQAISGRIEAVAADPSVSTASMRVTESGDRATIQAGDRVLMVVTEPDAILEGVDRKTLAEVTQVRIGQAIDAYRRARSRDALINSTLYALGATLALALVLFVGIRLLRRVYSAAGRYFHVHVETPGILVASAQTNRLWTPLSRLMRAIGTAAFLITAFLYAQYVLGLFPATRPAAENLLSILLGPLRTMGNAFVQSLPGLVFLALLVFVFRYALMIIRLFFGAIENGTISFAGFDRDWAKPTYQMVRVLVIAFGVVVAYPYLPGSDSAAFKGVSVFLGLMLSLSSSNAIANVIAGYMLTYRRAYKIGDRVKIGEAYGDVAEVRLQATYVRSLKNEEIVIPNSEILKTSVTNYSSMAKDRGLILHTTVGIGYDTPWRQVEAMLLEAAQRTPGLLQEPGPFVRQKELGDFAVTYEINAYCDKPQASSALYTALHRNILDIFNEYGVQIMTPAYVGDPKAPKVVPRDQQFVRLDAAGAAEGAELAGK